MTPTQWADWLEKKMAASTDGTFYVYNEDARRMARELRIAGALQANLAECETWKQRVRELEGQQSGGIGFVKGVWSTIEYLVIEADQPSLAAELARENGIGSIAALLLCENSSHEKLRMTQFVRAELIAPTQEAAQAEREQ